MGRRKTKTNEQEGRRRVAGPTTLKRTSSLCFRTSCMMDTEAELRMKALKRPRTASARQNLIRRTSGRRSDVDFISEIMLRCYLSMRIHVLLRFVL